jgi:Zn-dependent protease
MSDPAAHLADLVLKVPALLIAVTIHELAHALVADRLGDPTPRAMGRITLNPLPHLDLFGALAFFIAGFGWAKPVQVNAANLRHPRRDMALVAVAGPISNFVTAFVGLVLFVLARQSGLVGAPVTQALLWVFQFNLALGIFNLIPLPPLDGGHFLPYFFPRAGAALHSLEQFGPLILLVLVVSGATRYVVDPLFRGLANFYVAVVRLLL